jgi:tetratricopeptide (TPR) repeat protein
MKKLCWNGILSVIIFIVPAFSFAQTPKADSLNKLLSQSSDTAKVRLLGGIAIDLAIHKIYESALIKANEALDLASKQNYSSGIIFANNSIGIVYYLKGDYTNALSYHRKALLLAQQENNQIVEAITLNNIASVYLYQEKYSESIAMNSKAVLIYEEKKTFRPQIPILTDIAIASYYVGNYENALQNYLKALRINEKIDPGKESTDILLGLGNVYLAKGSVDQALKYYQDALSAAQNQKLKPDAAQALNNIGNIYNSKKDYEKGLENLLQALELKEQYGSGKGEIANSLINIGNVYCIKKNYGKAMDYYTRTLKLSEEIGNKNGLSLSQINIGMLYGKMGDLPKEIEFLQRGIVLARELGRKDLLKDAYQELADAYSKQKEFEKAFKFHTLYSSLKDTLLNETNTRSINELQTQYQTEKKEKAIKLLTQEKEIEAVRLGRQRILIYSILGGLILVLTGAGFITKSLRVTRKQKQIIERQKEVVEEQKGVVETKNKEITDSITYAKRLQKAILPRRRDIHATFPGSFILFLPKDIVSGDFYWMEKANDSILIAVGDCTGHGIGGAMLTIVCSNALNRAVKEFHLTEPGIILNKVRELVIETFEKSGSEIQDGMDISIAAINRLSGEVKWAGANNPLWYITGGLLKEQKADKQPIGKTDNLLPFTNHTLKLMAGDSIFLFTDGFADQFGGPKGKKFKYKALQELLSSNASLAPKDQTNHLGEVFAAWKGDLEQTDDVCVIGIRL